MTKRVTVGDVFDNLEAGVESVSAETSSLVKAKIDANESRTRTFIAYGAMAVGTAFLLVSATLGLLDGGYDELRSVWIVVGPLYGAVANHYFGRTELRNGAEYIEK